MRESNPQRSRGIDRRNRREMSLEACRDSTSVEERIAHGSEEAGIPLTTDADTLLWIEPAMQDCVWEACREGAPRTQSV